MIGTLKELDAQPGDVVECVKSSLNTKFGEKYTVNKWGDIGEYESGMTDISIFRIVPHDPDQPKTWGEMTSEEKGALLLAEHEGEAIEAQSSYDGKFYAASPLIGAESQWVVRVRPEPKKEAVEIHRYNMHLSNGHTLSPNKYRITLDLIDGEPDCDSIKMEKL